MSKLQDIRNLAQEHAVSVSSSPGNWMDYMDTASRLYRYSFSDQLLIHAQRPDATACASLELWNEKMLRWVNRGARGIALFDETWQNTKLHYVFDISDTHMVAGGRSPYLWKMQEHQREEILTHLAEVYALEEKDAATLQDALMAVAREMVNDNLEEYLDGLEYAVEGTYLEDLDEVTIRSDFRQLATDSVYYLLSRRCGLDPMELLEEEDFMHITDYNHLSVLTFLGNAASQLSESILIDIGKTVHKISLEEARKEVENSNERNYNNFITLMREIKNRDAETKKEENIENEGGTDYGTDISSQGRLPVSESDRRRGRSDDREIWDAAEDISERTQEQPLSEPVPDREAEPSSGADRESSTGENGLPDGEIAGEESGTGQGSRSDGMDSTHERTDGNSGREHLDGIGIQLVKDTREDGLSKAEEEIASALSLPEYPTANEQRRQIEERAAALYAREIPIPEEVVDEILRTGGNRKASQLRVIYNFMSEQTPEEYTEFVKREYRKGGKGFQIDGNEYSVWFDETGMQIAVGHTVTDHILDKAFLSWEDVSGRIHQLLDQGEYAPQSVLDAARSNAVKEHAQALAYMKGDMAEGVAEIVFDEEDLPHLRSIYPEITDYLEEKLEDPQWLSELDERLDALAEAYEENHSIMRFHHYNPVNISKQFQKFADEVIPYQARDGFVWKEHQMFITQDEIDSFLARGGPYSKDRLKTYSFYLLNENEKSRTDFVKEKYGANKRIHALPDVDDFYVNYDRKGLLLARGDDNSPYASISLSWKKVANRISYLIRNDQFLQAEDYVHMPEYEREQMANKILSFYARLPEGIDRPFTNDFFGAVSRAELMAVLERTEQTEELLQKMDAALAALSLDFEAYGTNYQQKTELLSELHQYAEGTYTIFPTPEAEPSFVEPSGHQMTMFDFLDTKAVAEPTVVDMSDVEKIEEEEVTAEESILKSQEQEKAVLEPHNFRIQDNDLGAGGPKAKYKANMEAIHLLQTLEKEERLAAPEEQEILSRYVGWGGIPQAFEENNSSWANEYLELKNTLSPEEYSAARASTLNAFYTSPTVIRSMYEALENMGLKQGNILEPSCGVGNFMGLIPESMGKANMYGVELDPVSGRIAKQLYQKNKIAVQGFEETSYPDNFFDCVIGNVPFGAYQVSDRRYDRHHFMIHDYFIAKSLDLVRPGGVVAVVTSSGTMDKQNPAVRQYIANRAELLSYMAQLSGKTEEELTEELAGVIFKNPIGEKWEPSDEYLSGNVREKLQIAKQFAEDHPEYQVNVQYLEQVQPKDLDASEIEARLGATWISEDYITRFMAETFHTPRYYVGSKVKVQYAEVTGQWNVMGKNVDSYGNALVTSTYGTQRANAYRLLEDALNLRDTKIYDTVQDADGEHRELNRKETMLAQQKQELMGHFDSWAATFGETVTAIELSPEGTGYRAKTRFARFFNLPELISIFKEAADIQTSDMLNLPVPEAEFINEVLKPSEEQQEMVSAFSERAEEVRAGLVNPTVDNMLKITNDGRKCALDQRLLNELLPDAEKSKVNTCVENAFQVWDEGKADRTTQLIFCDLSTPKGDGTFNVYDDVRNKLVARGIPKEEIAFIHEYNTETKKADLFAKVRTGQVRILMGSTPKLGAGTNVQDRLIALHHLDCPWKPSDLEQQEGRILRQGNQNDKVKIFRYVTENTFDAYMWVRHEVA